MKRLLCTVDERSVQQFYSEMEILANARHDNIVRFLGGCVQPDSLCILLEFCPRSLYDLVRLRLRIRIRNRTRVRVRFGVNTLTLTLTQPSS